LLIVGTEVYCCHWSHSTIHILGRTPLDGGSASHRHFYITQHTNTHTRERDIHSLTGVRIRNPWKRAPVIPHLREHNSVMEVPTQIFIKMSHFTHWNIMNCQVSYINIWAPEFYI
jgi:hypothetical protein